MSTLELLFTTLVIVVGASLIYAIKYPDKAATKLKKLVRKVWK